MSTLTIELSDDLAGWLGNRAAKMGLTHEEIVRSELEKVRSEEAEKPWMRLAGTVKGPRDLSTREGFGER